MNRLDCTKWAMAGLHRTFRPQVGYNPAVHPGREKGGVMTSGMTRDQIGALFMRRQGAYEDLDAAALAADYAPDAVIDSPSTGVHRAEAAEKNLRAVFDAFLDMTVSLEKLVIDGDNAATLLSIEGTHIGEFLGLEPTGKPFVMPAVFFYELRDGRIVRERRCYGFTNWLVQIGALKARPR